MSKQYWDKFIEFFGGEYNAREEFDRLCIELLELHYPGKQLINANKIDRIDKFHDLLLVYLPKLFNDVLNVSRKSHIRKAFNKTVEVAKEHDLKIFKFVVCTNHILTDNETQWWDHWKYRNEEQHKIEIELLDGNKLYELLKHYDLLSKWSPWEQLETEQAAETAESLLDIEVSTEESDAAQPEAELEIEQSQQSTAFEPADEQQATTVAEQSGQESTDKAEPQEQPAESKEQIQPEVTEIKEQIETTAEKSEPEPQGQEQTEAAAEKSELKDKQETQDQAQPSGPTESKGKQQVATSESGVTLRLYNKHKTAYLKLLEKIEKISPEAKKKFDQLREISEIKLEKFQSEPDLKQALEEKIIEVFFKARSAEVNKLYDQALFYYEILTLRMDEVKEKLKAKVPEIQQSIKFVERQLEFERHLLQGDLYLAYDKKLDALEAYEEALKLNDKNHEVLLKYNETLGDLMVEAGLYSEAVKAYQEALNNLKLSYEQYRNKLNKKLKLAKALKNYTNSKYIPLLADYFLLKARDIEENHLDQKLVNVSEYYRLKKTAIYSGILVGLIIGVWLGFKILSNLPSPSSEPTAALSTKKIALARSAYNLYDVALRKGDQYLERFNRYGYSQVHLIDSALDAYERAMQYSKFKSEAVEKYNKVKNLRQAYVRAVQKKINEQPDKYMVLMGEPSEGLRFFKFLFKPSDKSYGKYGYLDTNNQVVIAPMFDFDYNRHIKPGWQNFHNGKAVVCLVIQPADTVYFIINRKGKRISKIYHLRK